MKTWARVASLQFMKYMNIFCKNVFWATVYQWKNSDDDDDVREKQPYLLQSYCENHLNSYTWEVLCNAYIIVSKWRVIYGTSISIIL